jgi:hypothetical protein
VGTDISFGRNVSVAGDIGVTGEASVARNVYQPADSTVSPSLSVGGDVVERDVMIDEPCPCDEDEILDIDAIVETGKEHNHNEDVGLSQDATLDFVGSGGLELMCGRFYFGPSTVTGSDNVIVAHGRTAIFIDGDLTITGDFGVDLGEEGELDIFVSGNLVMTGSGTVGSTDRPAALRFYVGGEEDIALTGELVFAGNVYAPRAKIVIDGSDDVYGSFFAGDFQVVGTHDMHYDRAILRSDGRLECEDPDPPVECVEDDDCGLAFVCEENMCSVVLID